MCVHVRACVCTVHASLSTRMAGWPRPVGPPGCRVLQTSVAPVGPGLVHGLAALQPVPGSFCRTNNPNHPGSERVSVSKDAHRSKGEPRGPRWNHGSHGSHAGRGVPASGAVAFPRRGHSPGAAQQGASSAAWGQRRAACPDYTTSHPPSPGAGSHADPWLEGDFVQELPQSVQNGSVPPPRRRLAAKDEAQALPRHHRPPLVGPSPRYTECPRGNSNEHRTPKTHGPDSR